MVEGMIPSEIAEEAQKFETEKAAAKEVAPEQKLEARLEDGSFAQISPEFAGTDIPIKLEFRKPPELGNLLYLEKPEEITEKGKIGFRKFFRVEEPMRFVSKQEGTVYLRAEPVPPEEFEARKAESQDMRAYLTSETLAKLGL
jgi:hypothetical protein